MAQTVPGHDVPAMMGHHHGADNARLGPGLAGVAQGALAQTTYHENDKEHCKDDTEQLLALLTLAAEAAAFGAESDKPMTLPKQLLKWAEPPQVPQPQLFQNASASDGEALPVNTNALALIDEEDEKWQRLSECKTVENFASLTDTLAWASAALSCAVHVSAAVPEALVASSNDSLEKDSEEIVRIVKKDAVGAPLPRLQAGFRELKPLELPPHACGNESPGSQSCSNTEYNTHIQWRLVSSITKPDSQLPLQVFANNSYVESNAEVQMGRTEVQWWSNGRLEELADVWHGWARYAETRKRARSRPPPMLLVLSWRIWVRLWWLRFCSQHSEACAPSELVPGALLALAFRLWFWWVYYNESWETQAPGVNEKSSSAPTVLLARTWSAWMDLAAIGARKRARRRAVTLAELGHVWQAWTALRVANQEVRRLSCGVLHTTHLSSRNTRKEASQAEQRKALLNLIGNEEESDRTEDMSYNLFDEMALKSCASPTAAFQPPTRLDSSPFKKESEMSSSLPKEADCLSKRASDDVGAVRQLARLSVSSIIEKVSTSLAGPNVVSNSRNLSGLDSCEKVDSRMPISTDASLLKVEMASPDRDSQRLLQCVGSNIMPSGAADIIEDEVEEEPEDEDEEEEEELSEEESEEEGEEDEEENREEAQTTFHAKDEIFVDDLLDAMDEDDLWVEAMGPRSTSSSAQQTPRTQNPLQSSSPSRPSAMGPRSTSTSPRGRSPRVSNSPGNVAAVRQRDQEIEEEEVEPEGPVLPDPPDEICARISQYPVAELLVAAMQIYETLCTELTKAKSPHADHGETIARYSERCWYVGELVSQHVWTHERAPEVLGHLRAAEAAASCRACWPSELPDAQAVVFVPAGDGRMEAMTPEQFTIQANASLEPRSPEKPPGVEKQPETTARRSLCPCRRRRRQPPRPAPEMECENV